MDGLADQQVKHSKSWSSAVTDFRSIKHSHSWTIRGFSRATSTETVFKPVSSSNDVSPTFRVRLLPVDQNVVRLSLVSDDLTAKYLARINLYNARKEKIITKSYNNILHTDHMEEIPRQTLLAQIGPEDELRIEVDLTITFDTTVTETSTGKGDKTAEQGINPTAEHDTTVTNAKGEVKTTVAEPNKTILNKAAASQAAPTSSQSGVNRWALLRTVVINLSYPGSATDTQCSVVALVDTGATLNTIKPSVAQAFGTWTKPNILINSVSGIGGGVLPVQGQVFLDVRIGNLVVNQQRFLVVDTKTPQNVTLGTDFHDAVGSVTFHKDSLQLNGGETIPYTTVARGIIWKSTPMNNKTNTNAKVRTTVAKPNNTIPFKAAASQPASKLFQPGVNQSLAPIAISLSNPGKDTKYSVVALVNSGIAGNLIKPSVAQTFGPWIESEVPVASIVGPGANISVDGLLFLDVRIGDSVLQQQRFFVADFEFGCDVMLGRESSVTLHKDTVQVNGKTVRYASVAGGNSVVCKSTRTDQNIGASNGEDQAGVSDKK